MPRRSSMRSIDGRSLDLADVVAVARGREPVRLAPAAAKRDDASRRALEKVVAKGALAYGIKTGFGELANVAISDADVRALQINLLRSHAVGQGPPLRQDEVRAALLLRANTLAMGYSGVRRILVTRLLQLLDRGVHPVVPSRGSLGASGDLAPLAHLGLVLVGEGRARVGDDELDGAAALARAGLAPLELAAKEGLALINGTQFMAAIGALVVARARRIERMLNPSLSDGLPAFLTREGGLNSGFMIAQYVAASLVSENKVLAHPASVDSIPTSAGQEDHVSMGATAAVHLWRVAANVDRVLAVELLCGAQGVDFLAPLRPGPGIAALHEHLRSVSPHLDDDRSLAAEIEAVAGGIRDGSVVAAVEHAFGPLR